MSAVNHMLFESIHMYMLCMYVCRYLTSNRNQITASIQIRVGDLNRDQRYIYLCMYVRKMKKKYIMLLGLLKMVLPYAIAKRMWHALRYSTRSKICWWTVTWTNVIYMITNRANTHKETHMLQPQTRPYRSFLKHVVIFSLAPEPNCPCEQYRGCK